MKRERGKSDWCWGETRLFNEGRALRSEGWRDALSRELGVEGVAVYVVLCTYLGSMARGDQTGFTSVKTLARLSGTNTGDCWTGIQRLETRGLLKVREGSQGFAFTLLDRGTRGQSAPRQRRDGGYFWWDRRIVGHAGRTVHSLAVYALLAAMADEHEQCYPGEALIEGYLGLGSGSGANQGHRLQEAGWVDLKERASPWGTNLYTLLAL